MKKKGTWFLKNAASLILAVIGLFFVFLLVFQLYNFFQAQEIKNAQAVIDNLMQKINSLKEKEEGNFVIQGIDGWTLVGFEKDGAIPDKCFPDSCICICETRNFGTSLLNYKKTCQAGGLCRAIKQDRISLLVFLIRKDGSVSNTPKWRGIFNLESMLYSVIVRNDEDILIIDVHVAAEKRDEAVIPLPPEGVPLN